MNCRSLEKWVWQEGAGNLPVGAVEHASACPDCRALIERVCLLDRSVGASVVPDPDEAYWDAMVQRIASRLDHPTDRIIELLPSVSAWRRFVARAWVPTMAVGLLAVVGSQRTVPSPSLDKLDVARVQERIAVLSSPKGTSADESYRLAQATNPTAHKSETQSTDAPSMRAVAPTEEITMSASPKVGESQSNEAAVSTRQKPTISESEPALARRDDVVPNGVDEVWPERQVTIMGEIDSDSPSAPSADDRRLAAQDPFGAYERQMADAEQGLESVSTFASPGRLLDGPAASSARGSERLTPAEQMRRFDEMAELHDLIERLEAVPASSRAMSQWTQWSTAWYRMGMLSNQRAVLDSAITAVGYFQVTVPVDSAAQAEWLLRTTHLEKRRENLER